MTATTEERQRHRFQHRDTEHYDYPQLCAFQDSFNEAELQVFFRDAHRFLADEVALYVHVPFCASLCPFCNYYKVLRRSVSETQLLDYVEALLAELRFYAALLPESKRRLIGVQFGGGTPSTLPVDLLRRILAGVRDNFHLPPGSLCSTEVGFMALLDPEYLAALRDTGINRVSFGVQTFSPDIRRQHALTAAISRIDEAVANLQGAGLTNYSADLMYNFPGQTPEKVLDDIERLLSLDVVTIDLYALNVYPGTRLYHRYLRDNIYIPYLENCNRYQAVYRYVAGRPDINMVMSNTISTKVSRPHATLTAHLGGNRDYGGCVIGIGPSSKGYIDGYVYKNHVALGDYVDCVKLKGHGIGVASVASLEEQGNRTLVMFPNFTRIGKSDARLLPRHSAQVEMLLDEGYLADHGDHYQIPAEQCFWAGNISACFYSEPMRAKMLKSYLLTRRQRRNLYNQDSMQMARG